MRLAEGANPPAGEIVHLRDTVPLPTVITGVVAETPSEIWPGVDVMPDGGWGHQPAWGNPPLPLSDLLARLEGKRVYITIEVLPD